jgi:hypothetical protein
MAKAAGVDAISFWPTGNPFYGISYRYRMGQLNHIGIGTWKGRELDLRKPAKGQPIEPLWPERPPENTGLQTLAVT